MESTDTSARLYIALDLGSTKWTLAFSDGRRSKPRLRTIAAHDLEALQREVADARSRMDLPASSPVRSCFEAGRDGFWLHRVMERWSWDNVVVDPGSLERPAKKRAKTDRLDTQTLLDRLMRHHRGERVWSVVNVPPPEVEDVRRLERERERLTHERGALRSRMFSVLALCGVPKDGRRLPRDLASVRDCEGRPLGLHVRRELERLRERLDLIERQRRELEQERQPAAQEVAGIKRAFDMLFMLRGIGALSAFSLSSESFGWRTFRNTREVGASSGLVPTPHRSDQTGRERGISKAARPKLRSLMVQLAWLWLRYQPDSALSIWFRERWSNGGGRAKRVGIVALARKLYVALWKYVTYGEVPEGVQLKRA